MESSRLPVDPPHRRRYLHAERHARTNSRREQETMLHVFERLGVAKEKSQEQGTG